jgi:hypothetical protein
VLNISERDRTLLVTDPSVFISYFSDMNLQDFQCEILRIIDDNEHERVIVLLPAQHGKSTLIVLWYAIFKIAQNRNIRIIIVMKNDAEVRNYARAIRSILANNRKLIDVFGRFQPQGRDTVWSNDAIEVLGRQIDVPQPTILFASSNSIDQVLGKRCDVYLCDDIVTPTTVSTQEQRDKQFEVFNQGIETGPQYIWDMNPNGTLAVPEGIDWPRGVRYKKGVNCGTVFHPDDLFHRKIERPGLKIADMENGKLYKKCKDPRYVAIKYDCWKDKALGKTLWPGRWTPEALNDLEKSDKRAFDMRMRNIALDETSTVFRKAWIRGGVEGSIEYPGCLNRSRSFGETDFPRRDGNPFERPYTVLGLDPSTGRRGNRTTFSSFVVLRVDLNENPMRRYMMDVFRAQLGFDDIISYLTMGDENRGIEGFFTKYHYDEGRVESNAAQTYLLNNARVSAAGLHGCVLVPHETQARNKNDAEIGVQSMSSAFKDGMYDIPYEMPSDQELADDFIDQLLSFPVGLFDYAMATWFAELAVRRSGSRYKAYGPQRGQRIVNRAYVQR